MQNFTRIYEDLNKTSENRLKGRSWYIPEGEGRILLNGTWSFFYSENGDRVEDIKKWEFLRKSQNCFILWQN